jgi:hypothetical protein
MRRLTVAQAAEALGITTDAVRMRLSRGTLTSEKQEGRVYVLLEDDLTSDVTGDTPGPARELVDAKDETIRLLTQQLESERRANEENRRIIAALTSRIPEIEAPSTAEPRGGDLSAEEEPEPSTPSEARTAQEAAATRPEEAARRPWWRRVFGS